MPSRDNSYSRLVALAKIVLPLAALGLLSTLFLLSRGVDTTGSLPYTRVDIEQRAREQGVSRPTYAGVTDDGTAISVSAAKARPTPGDPDRIEAEALSTRMDFADGSHAEIVAPRGAIDPGADRAEMGGGVAITTSDGYRVETLALIAALGRTEIVAETALTATGPFGQLEAGRMRVTADPDGPGYLVVFKGGVKLLYDPQNK